MLFFSTWMYFPLIFIMRAAPPPPSPTCNKEDIVNRLKRYLRQTSNANFQKQQFLFGCEMWVQKGRSLHFNNKQLSSF